MTKMKYHKIRNIDLKTCTVEQVAAYNLCWLNITDLMIKRYFKLECEFQKSDARYEIRQFIFNNLKQSYDFEKFKKHCNLDALQNCLDNGLDAYLNLKKDGKTIFLDYDEVSKIFRADYL